MARDGANRDAQTESSKRQQEVMTLLSGETRHSVIMTILGHPEHLVSQAELEEMTSKSTGAIDGALRQLEESDIIAQYSIEDPDNPNERDYPTTFWGPTEQGIRTLHEYNYLRLVPAQRALFDSTSHSDIAKRHLKADRPQLPTRIEDALSFETPEDADSSTSDAESSDREDQPLFADEGRPDADEGNGASQEPDSSTEPETGLAGFVDDALAATQADEDVAEDIIEEVEDPQIAVAGCGNAGNNTINRVYNIGAEGLDTIAVNTDKQHLQSIAADTKILVGKSITEGLGAGGDPAIGARTVEMARDTLGQIFNETDLVFVTAGMGGGTGTGGAPIVSKIAKEQGNIVVGIVSTPFNVERARTVKAEEGLQRMHEEADSVLVLDNNRLLDYVPNLPIGKAFSVMDQVIAETVKAVSETIAQPSLANLDYQDVAAVMNRGGLGVVFAGESEHPMDTDNVARNVLNHPFLDVDYRGATRVLVHVTGGPELSRAGANRITKRITEHLKGSPKVVWGACRREDYEDKVRVTAIMTGIDSSQILGPTTYDAASEGSPVTPHEKRGPDIVIEEGDPYDRPQRSGDIGEKEFREI